MISRWYVVYTWSFKLDQQITACCQINNFKAPNEHQTLCPLCHIHELLRYAKAAQMWLYLRRQIRMRAFSPVDPGDFIVPQLKPSGCQLQAHTV